MKARPKKTVILQIADWKFLVTLNPRKKWEYEKKNGKHCLSRDMLSINFTDEEFEKYFKKIN